MTKKNDVLDFLPENYEAPWWGWNYYFKFQDWDNKIRFLDSPILGWRIFVKEWDDIKKLLSPYKEKPAVPENAMLDFWEPAYRKHVWLCKIFNYDEDCVQFMELDKQWIQKEIVDLLRDLDFWNPMWYDIKITKEWQKKETRYFIKALPPKVFQNEEAIKISRQIDLEIMFEGWDPFEMLKNKFQADSADWTEEEKF